MENNSCAGRFALFFLSLILLFTTNLNAGTTGKITGKVVDVRTGQPLIGCNIVIEKTYMGAATDMEGRYIIMNVPPGIYTLRASMMGYKELRVERVRVSMDHTTEINFALEPTVLEIAETITVVAERPLVKMDMTSSLTSVESEEIESLPVQEMSDVLELQAGLVKDPLGGLHVRGGRSGEVAYWINGVAATDVYSGNLGVEVENAVIEELQVVSGTFNAEYGQAMSAIVNIITKEGGRNFTGQVKVYAGDYVSGEDIFSVLSEVSAVRDSLTGRVKTVEKREKPLKYFNPAYNLQFSISGPIPLSGDKLNFFTTGRYFYNEGWLYGRRWFTPQGIKGDSALVPMNPFEKFSLQGKLSYRVSSGLKLSYDIFLNRNKWERSFWHSYKYNPEGVPRQFERGRTQILALNHVLSTKTFYEAKITRFYSDYSRYVYKEWSKVPNYLARWIEYTDTDTLIHFIDYSTGEGKAELDSIKAENIPFTWVIDPRMSEGYVHPDSSRAPTSYSFLRAGMDLSQFKRSTTYWVGKLDLTSQVTKSHLLKTGVEIRLHKLTLEDFTIQPERKENEAEELVPFQPWLPPLSTIYHNSYTRRPVEFSAYIQDKMELKDMIVNMGLRFDYFDSRGVVPIDPSDPNIYDPIKREHIYRNPDAPDSLLVEYTPQERRAFMHTGVDPKMKLSPRLGIAYPITDRGVIHFSYGHFFQIPLFEYLYANPDFKVSKGGGITIVGNADLNPQRTVMYEIGLQQQLGEDIGFDVTLFYRDVRDWVGTSALISTPIPSVKYSKFENKDYSNVRGVTLSLNKRYSNYFSASLDYSYLVAEGTYSNPTDAFNAALAKQEPRMALIPLDWDQRHTINGTVSMGTSDWRISFIGRYWTGRPYTPNIAKAEMVGATTYRGLRDNSERLPSRNSFDVYLYRRFNPGTLEFSVFINIYNLFDQKNETWIYTDTGTASYTTYINPKDISYDARRIGTVADFVNHPEWYTEPRQIQIGFTLGF
ncbi:MAG: carboxypeptidase-like regulatory domain-containing protein [Fidelibacterota bacterium]